MITENMYQAKTHLSKLVDKALQGEEVILAKAGKPLVKLVPVLQLVKPVKMGLLEGAIKISDDFNEFAPEIEDMFDGYLPE
jgi:prevent-host-death family protein